MRTRQWFLMLFSILLLCVAVFSSSLAEEDLKAIVKKIKPSVVCIIIYDENGDTLGLGSGFFINQMGNVITNRHVLEGATKAEVKTADGKTCPIKKVLAEDKEGDLILVSVEIPKGAVPPPLSVSASIPEVAEDVVVIGCPLWLEQTVTKGIVSAVRDIPLFDKIIQIDAALSPGSSGSPVLNLKGEVIGVAWFVVVGGENLNFVIPGERVTKLTPGKGQTLSEWKTGKAEERLASAEELYYKGLSFIWAGDYEKALPYFEEVVKKDTIYAEAYLQIGYCKGELGLWNEALEAFKQAIRIKPDFAMAHFNLGVAYDRLGLWNEALEAYKQAIRLKPDLAEAHYGLGLAYDKLRLLNEAVATFKQAIRLKPDLAEAHYGLGVAYGELGLWNEALEAFKQAIRLKPDFAEAHLNLGAAYGELGRYTEEVEAFKQAIRLKPDLAEAHFNLGAAYGELGRYTEAVEAYKQAIRLKPDYAEAHYNLGVAYAKLGLWNEALEAYKQAIRLKPDLAEAHYGLGLAYGKLGLSNEAVAAFEQAIRIKPDYAEVHYYLGVTYLIIDDKASALDEYKILKDLDKDLANKLFNLIYK